MKVRLIKPPEKSTFNFGSFSLAVLAAAVREFAEVSILDATELDPGAAAAKAVSDRPDLVGVTVMGIPSIEPAVRFIQAVRAANGSGARVVAGGHGASMLPDLMLDAGADAVVVGEGEETFREILAEGIREGMPGVVTRVGGNTVSGPFRPPILPFSRIGLPARDLVPPPPSGIHLMETSRGCPHSCAFCETTRYYGRRWRPHTPERVVAEIRELMNHYDAWIVHIADDNFTASVRRMFRICELLLEGQLPAFILASARADDLLRDPGLLPAMARARMLRISVGVETLDPHGAELIEKPISAETYREAFLRMRELGIYSVASFIVGLPGEEGSVEDAVEAAVTAGPDSAHFLPFLPMPGTPLAVDPPVTTLDPTAVRRARALSQGFYGDPRTVARLQNKAARDDPVGIMARATLDKYCGGA